jgi:hypothetical protein|nr:hypothetical protein [uncultured Methanoregula sp.]
MVRGKKPTTIIEEAGRCAERMGFCWLKNTLTDLPFDGFIFRPAVIAAVKLKKVRYAIDDDVIIEQKFPDEVGQLRSLPLPQNVLRELWVRTQNERAWRRFYILPGTTMEIEFNSAENYRNTHYDEKKWDKAPYRIDISLAPKKRDDVE